MIDAWAFTLSLPSSKLLVFPQHMVFSIQGDEKRVSLRLQTLWLYQQSYVLCCSAWINFTTCCLFQNWHSWASELTLVLPASSVCCCIWLHLKALLVTYVWLWSCLDCWWHLKAVRQQSGPYSQSLACRTLLQQKNPSLLLTLSKSVSPAMRNIVHINNVSRTAMVPQHWTLARLTWTGCWAICSRLCFLPRGVGPDDPWGPFQPGMLWFYDYW